MDYDSYSDKQIIDGILQNDPSVIGYFFNKKCSKLFSYIIFRVFDGKADQRELISEFFLYLRKDEWQKVRQFNYRSKLMTWVTVVAVRFFQKKREELIEKDPSTPLTDQLGFRTDPMISLERRMDVRTALEKIPNERFRRVLKAIYFGDVSPEQLAKEMNTTVENIYNMRHRAIKQLRNILSGKEDYYD